MANGKSQEEITAFIELFLTEIRNAGSDLLNVAGVLYEYREGYWAAVGTEAKERYEKILYETARREPFDYSTKHTALWRSIMSAVVIEGVEFDKRPLLVCKNGTLDLITKEVHDHSKEHYTRRRIDVSYDPKAECPEWLTMYARIFEDQEPEEKRTELMTFLQEWMGLAIVGGRNFHRDMRRGLIIEGPSRSGKSTITAVLRELFGKEYVASPTIEQLGTQFGRESLINAMAIMRDDGVTEGMRGDSALLKAIVTGEEIQIDRKFKTPVMISFDGPVLFTSNIIPKVTDESNAIYNRFAFLQMTRVFSEEDSEAHFGKGSSALEYLQSKGELPGILNWCLAGFARVKKRGRLYSPKSVVEAGTYFRRQNDAALDFVLSCTKKDKRTSNNTDTLATAMVEYALQKLDQKISVKRAARQIDRVVREVYEEQKKLAEEAVTGSGYVYPGIRLNEQGMAWLGIAKEKGNGRTIKSGVNEPVL